MKVCWDKDQISGEANYDIDNDVVRGGKTLFPQLNISRKIDLFENKLIDILKKEFIKNIGGKIWNEIPKKAIEEIYC